MFVSNCESRVFFMTRLPEFPTFGANLFESKFELPWLPFSCLRVTLPLGCLNPDRFVACDVCRGNLLDAIPKPNVVRQAPRWA